MSERKRAEIALRESEQRFRQLADAMPQIVWTARPDGNIDYLNRRWTEFTGLPQTVGNDGWGPLLHPDDAPSADERWAASVASGAPFEMELRLLDRRQQSYRWHLIRTVAVPNGDGKVARWFGTSTDIHEQKRAEESSRFLAEASAALAGVVDYESTLQKVANLAVPYFADWSAVDVADEDGSLRRLAVAHQDPDKIALVHELMREYPPDPQSPVGAFAVLRTGKPEIVSEITDEMLVQRGEGRAPPATDPVAGPEVLHLRAAGRLRQHARRSSRSPPPSRAESTPRPTSPWRWIWRTGRRSPSRTPSFTRRCGKPTAARTSSWRRWPTSFATRWPPSAMRCKSSRCPGSMRGRSSGHGR